MESFNYTLHDLLCLSEFRKVIPATGMDDICKAITEWAEQEVLSGNDSGTLLILASLNLDKTPDEDEVRRYFDRYRAETGLSYPAQNFSALIWLKIQISKLIHASNAQSAVVYLSFFATTWLDCSPRFFAKTCGYLNWLYYNLMDDYGDLYPSLASEMTSDEILAYIKKHLIPFEKKLSNDDWLNFLSEE